MKTLHINLTGVPEDIRKPLSDLIKQIETALTTLHGRVDKLTDYQTDMLNYNMTNQAIIKPEFDPGGLPNIAVNLFQGRRRAR